MDARPLRPSAAEQRGSASTKPATQPAVPPTPEAEIPAAGGGRRRVASAADAGVEAARRARAAELGALRGRERAARQQLSEARRRIVELERDLAAERRPDEAEQRDRHEFDLTPEDWKKLATEGQIKFRLPCTGRSMAPSEQQLLDLGLAPEDSEVLQRAYEHSQARQESALSPLCATALGGRRDLAEALSVSTSLSTDGNYTVSWRSKSVPRAT